MHIGNYINMVQQSQQDLADAFLKVAGHHGHEPDVQQTCQLLAGWSSDLEKRMQPFSKKYEQEKSSEPDRLMNELFSQPRKGSMGLLRDLQDLYIMASEAELCSIILQQAAFGLRDKELIGVCDDINKFSKRQLAWLLTRMKASATQTLIVA